MKQTLQKLMIALLAFCIVFDQFLQVQVVKAETWEQQQAQENSTATSQAIAGADADGSIAAAAAAAGNPDGANTDEGYNPEDSVDNDLTGEGYLPEDNEFDSVANYEDVNEDWIFSGDDEGNPDEGVEIYDGVPQQTSQNPLVTSAAAQTTPPQPTPPLPDPASMIPPSLIKLAATVGKYYNKQSPVTLNEVFASSATPKIYMKQGDLTKLKTSYCAAEMMPDYSNDFKALYGGLPEKSEKASEAFRETDGLSDFHFDKQHVRSDIGVSQIDLSNSADITKLNQYFSNLKNEVPEVAPNNTPEVQTQNRIRREKIKGYVLSARDEFTQNWRQQIEDQVKLIGGANGDNNSNGDDNDLSKIECVTGESREYIIAKFQTEDSRTAFLDEIKRSIDDLQTLDIRILKMLVYLVTPKTEGGAGHWRLKVNRLFQDKDRPYSTESDAYAAMDTQTSQDDCQSGMTAAECGRQQAAQNGNSVDATAEEANGDQSDVSITGEGSQDSTPSEAEQVISRHTAGQAVDISEVDDIRCTVIKRVRVGSDKKEQKPATPIKLAWQGADGTGGSGNGKTPTDLAGQISNYASEAVENLIQELGQDPSEYAGDLSRANLTDIAQVVGQSLLNEIMNSSAGFSLSDSIGDTLETLGGSFFADYLGIPRQIFVNQKFDSLDDLSRVIGRAAIEKRLNLPFGSLEGERVANEVLTQVSAYPATGDAQLDEAVKKAYTNPQLAGTLINIGVRKIEYEAQLSPGSLVSSRFISTQWDKDQPQYNNLLHPDATAEDQERFRIQGEIFDHSNNGMDKIYRLFGERMVEDALKLDRGTLEGFPKGSEEDKFPAFKKYLGRKGDLIQNTPQYLDGILHVPVGTTREFITGTGDYGTASKFLIHIGEIRHDETLRGLEYYAMSNVLYGLPYPTTCLTGVRDTWGDAINGGRGGLLTIGIYTLARMLATSTEYTDSQNRVNTTTHRIAAGDGFFGADYAQEAYKDWLIGGLLNTESKVPEKATKKTVTIYKEVVPQPNRSDDDANEDGTDSRPNDDDHDGESSHPSAYNCPPTGTPLREVIDSKTVDIADTKVKQAGLNRGDLYRMFGYTEASGGSVYTLLGSKLLFIAFANKALGNSQKALIDLSDTRPEMSLLRDPEVKFYYDRVVRSSDLIKKIKGDWENEGGPDTDFSKIKSLIISIDDGIGAVSNDLASLNVTKAAAAARTIVGDIDRLKQEYLVKRNSYVQFIDKINLTIIDLNELIRNVSEILAGKTIPSADLLTIDQIQTNSFNRNNADRAGASGKNGKRVQITPQMVFNFFTGNISAQEFFLALGATQVESSLDLPTNSLIYYVQNIEARGVGNMDAFYASIGQAKIEEIFGMPSFYFQGRSLLSKKPNFDRDMDALATWYVRYLESDLGITETVEQARSYLTRIKTTPDLRETYRGTVRHIAYYWDYTRKQEMTEQGNAVFADKDLDDMANNLVSRNLAKNVEEAKKDILFKMGMPGDYNGLTGGSAVQWQLGASQRAGAIDQKLLITKGSTKRLYTGDYYNLNLNKDEKQQIEDGAIVNLGALDYFADLVNGNLTLENLKQLGLAPGYTQTNPYAKIATSTDDTCPDIFPDGNNGNDKTLEPNTYCVYYKGISSLPPSDPRSKGGRKCYKSLQLATEFQNSLLPEQRYGDILEEIAHGLANALNQGTEGDDPEDGVFNREIVIQSLAEDLHDKLVLFINHQIDSVLTEEQIDKLGTGQEIVNAEGSMVLTKTISREILEKAFKRQDIKKPLFDYKVAVGKITAKKLISYKLFGSLGLNVDPNLFGPDEFFQIMQGDLRPIWQVGAAYLDDVIGFNRGTSYKIINALSKYDLDCILSQTGAQMLGHLLGMESIPLTGNIYRNIGQSKLEETLKLPKGTFKGDNLEQVIRSVGPLNFALAFKIPVAKSATIDQPTFERLTRSILGADTASSLSGSTNSYRLEKIRNYVLTTPVINDTAVAAVKELDDLLVNHILSFMGQYADTASWVWFVPDPNSSDAADRVFVDERSQFTKKLSAIDRQFLISDNSTLSLLLEDLSPNDYLNRVARNTLMNIMMNDFGQMLGLSDEQAAAVTGVARNVARYINCRYPGIFNTEIDDDLTKWKDDNGHEILSAKCGDYINISSMYSELVKVFGLQLDSMIGFAPGSIQQMLNDPSHAYQVLLREGARRLDQQLHLNSGTLTSFTGLTNRAIDYFGRALDANFAREQQCLEEAYNDAEKWSFWGQPEYYPPIYDYENGSSQAIPVGIYGNRNSGSNLATMRQQHDDEYRILHYQAYEVPEPPTSDASRHSTWQTNHDRAIEQIGYYQNEDKHRTDYVNACKNARRNAGTNDNGSTPYPRRGVGQLILNFVIEYAKDLAAEKVHNYLLNLKDSDGRSIGIDMPKEDIKKLFFQGRLEYLLAATIAIGINLVYRMVDGEQRSHVVPAGFRISYREIAVAVTGQVPDNTMFNSMFPENEQILSQNGALGRNSWAPEGEVPLTAFDDNAYDRWLGDYGSGATDDSYDHYLASRIREESRKRLQYRMMDTALWKVDNNIFPGFVQIMMTGSGSQRLGALSVYIQNGLMNGHIGPLHFDAIDPNVVHVLAAAVEFFTGDYHDMTRFETFVTTGGYAAFNSIIASQSERWIGIKLSPDMVGGLITGICTGQWGFGNGPIDSTNGLTSNVQVGGRTVPTLASAVVNWGLGRLFAWADKRLGLPPGTAQQVYNLGIAVYRAVTALVTEIRGVWDVANSLGMTFDDAAAWMSDVGYEGYSQAKIKVGAAITQLVTFVIMIWLNNEFAADFAKFDESMGFVPGTTSMMAGLVVETAVASVVSIFTGNIIANMGGPWAIAGQLLIILIMNLFGVYKIEVKCDADNYYPESTSAEPDKYQFSGLGEWNGKDSKLNEAKAAQAAQVKAKQLIIDVLNMQDSKRFTDAAGKPIIPVQVMTGRPDDIYKEDPDGNADSSMIDLISQKLCLPRFGSKADKTGICGGNVDIRSGVFSNPANAAFTHIGF